MTNCNIIIPTFNRPTYLRRILYYYDSFGKNLKIIVADSSSDENKELNKEIIWSVSNLDIKYLDNYSTEINLHHKMTDVVNYVEGEYCVFCADDDFITPSGIEQAINFLETNPDFTIAHGQYIGFHLGDGEKRKKQFYWKPAYSHESITFSDPTNRLSHHLSHYSQLTFYAVHRTGLLKMAYKEALKFSVDPILFGELLPSMLTLIYGKMKCLDVLYAARDIHSVGNWPLSLKNAIQAGTYNREYAKFRDCLSTHLSKESRLDIEESRKVVDGAMSAYIKKYYYPSRSKMGYISTKMGHVLDCLNLPDWLGGGIRRSYAKLARSSPIEKHSIDMSPGSKYYNDFSRIRHHVLSYLEISVE